jgi:Cys-rich four helix bundle protein (predicted Tat secretion target)
VLSNTAGGRIYLPSPIFHRAPQHLQEKQMDRRNWLQSGIALSAAMAATMAGAAEKKSKALPHLHHHADEPAQCHEMPGGLDHLIRATSRCVSAADICLAHCLELLGQGDKTMAACARSVVETRAICDALRVLASQKSKATHQVAAVAADLCKACEAECRKHAEHHTQCKDCADACAECVKVCGQFATPSQAAG